ncbi:hypothetical protein TNCT_685371 [Trichonephila clavata]|uniref:Uncharacterized protein n=1 Tax=Trichonephila clavata TaxID=2740835 RepID=A0A8X6L693_TRICU|nr:hypothetical protein TNCT_685371 [Trichonephila clavata]
MKLFPDYNLILQDLQRSHLTATNTHIAGFIKIQAETQTHRQEIEEYLISKKVEHYVNDPPPPQTVVIKGLLASTDPEDVKNDLVKTKESNLLTSPNSADLKQKTHFQSS